MEIIQPDLSYSRHNLDFGKGYYVTTLQEQAEKWAKRKGRMSKKTAIVSVYALDESNLNILSFDGYTEQWLDFVVQNRLGKQVLHNHDAIYGNIADDDVATVVNDYVRLLGIGRISQNSKSFFLEQLQYSKPNNQYCIVTQRGLDALKFIESYLYQEV